MSGAVLSPMTTEVEKIVLEMWLEAARDNVTVWRVINGVAEMLGLRKDELIRYLPKFLPISLLQVNSDVRLGLEDAVVLITDTLIDSEGWDAYHESHAPSAYRHAAAVVAWLYLYAEHLGATIPRNCLLFSDNIAAAVAKFLATKVARPIADAVRQTAVQWMQSLPPKRRDEVAQLLREQRETEVLIRSCLQRPD